MTTPQISDAQIAEAAYFLWEAEGRPANRSADHWFRAQSALKGSAKPKRRAAAKPKPAKAAAPKKAQAKPAGARKAAPKAKA